MNEYPQDQEENEYRYTSAGWINEIAKGLTKGAEKHPGETWRSIPEEEHLARAMRHINMYLMGDRSEPHIINASMRLMMAFETEKTHQKKDICNTCKKRTDCTHEVRENKMIYCKYFSGDIK